MFLYQKHTDLGTEDCITWGEEWYAFFFHWLEGNKENPSATESGWKNVASGKKNTQV